MTTENTETIAETIEEVQVKNPAALLAKNKELLRELADTKAALQAAQNELGKAQSDKTAMSDRWYQEAVIRPLETELGGISGTPVKYILDTVKALGLLKMQPDEHGVERPTWFDENGIPADLKNGLNFFLNQVNTRMMNGDKPNLDLARCIRATASGSGATGFSGHRRTDTTTATTQAPTQQFGIR